MNYQRKPPRWGGQGSLLTLRCSQHSVSTGESGHMLLPTQAWNGQVGHMWPLILLPGHCTLTLPCCVLGTEAGHSGGRGHLISPPVTTPSSSQYSLWCCKV